MDRMAFKRTIHQQIPVDNFFCRVCERFFLYRNSLKENVCRCCVWIHVENVMIMLMIVLLAVFVANVDVVI